MSRWLTAFREASASDQANILSAPKNLTATAIDGETYIETPPKSKENLSMLNADSLLGAERPVDVAPAAVPKANVVGSEWDAETADLIAWFLRTPPPAKPFELGLGVTVLRPKALWDYLRRDIAAGPGCGRAYYGAFQADLKRLYELFGPEPDEPAPRGQP